MKVTQDTAGNYDISYNVDGGFRKETSKDGKVEGSYTYLDKDGHLQVIRYTAGKEGFVVLDDHAPAQENVQQALPHPVTETPEVAAERAKHMAIFEEALKPHHQA